MRYELGLSIERANIIRAYAPFPAGTPDVSIFRDKLKLQLVYAHEFAVTHDGYASLVSSKMKSGRLVTKPGGIKSHGLGEQKGAGKTRSPFVFYSIDIKMAVENALYEIENINP